MENSDPSPPRVAPAATTESRWILLVDDEASIRMLLGTVLTDHGWEVHAAGDADDAIAMIDASATPPALLICDVLMPGMDGLEMARQLVVRLPRMKVIFISGHLTDASLWPADLSEHRFLPKPFSNDQLTSLVMAALAEGDEPR